MTRRMEGGVEGLRFGEAELERFLNPDFLEPNNPLPVLIGPSERARLRRERLRWQKEAAIADLLK